MKLFELAFEDEGVNQPKKNSEVEIAIYAKITDMEGLKQASEVIQQEQLESEFFNGVRCRVRKETKGTDTTYEFTYKVKKNNGAAVSSNDEYNLAIDENFFEGFRNVAKKRVKKTRYIFKSKSVEFTIIRENGERAIVTLPSITYEVDVYNKKDNTTSTWCKIDVELDTILPIIGKHSEGKPVKIVVKVSHLPFKPMDSILGTTTDPDKKTVLGKIWDTEWNLPPFDTPVTQTPVPEPESAQKLTPE